MFPELRVQRAIPIPELEIKAKAHLWSLSESVAIVVFLPKNCESAGFASRLRAAMRRTGP
jgi:hypothetical protein